MNKITNNSKNTRTNSGKSRLPADKSKTFEMLDNRKTQEETKPQRISGEKQLNSKLFNSGITSFRQLAETPGETLIKRFDKQLNKDEKSAIYAARKNAQHISVYAADRAMEARLARSQNAMWLVRPGDKLPDRLICDCGCCDSVFSLKAYLFDLLDLLQHYWNIEVEVVETLLLRSFSELHVFDRHLGIVRTHKLSCEALNAQLPQNRIAVEVLEAYFGGNIALTVNDAVLWREQFVDQLLRLITPQEVMIPILAGTSTTARLTFDSVNTQLNVLTTVLPGDDEITKNRRVAIQQRLQPFSDALVAWKAELNALMLNLADIDKAESLLNDYTKNFTGFSPNTLISEPPSHANENQKRAAEITQQFEQLRDNTIRQWLVDYRNMLQRATNKSIETLEASLFISLNSGACRTTTRLQELVISVQQIIENIRSGEIATLDRVGLNGEVRNKLIAAAQRPMAERTWQRLRDYETWLGYMYGWVYPENVLSPLVNEIGGESFAEVLEQLQAEALTPESIRAIYVEAVTSLKGN